MRTETFFEKFELLAAAPNAVAKMRELVLQLAVQGKLVESHGNDGAASQIFTEDRPTDGEVRYEIAENWIWIRFASVGEQRLGKMLDQKGNKGVLKPYLRNTNVQWMRFQLNDIKEIRLERDELQEFRLLPGDLLICEGGEPGRCAIWRDQNREMYFQKAIHRVRPRNGILPEYLAICLQVDAQNGELARHFTGATIKHFTGRSLSNYSIPLPPLVEQKRIVAKVDELMALCDRLEAQQAERETRHGHLARASLARFADAPMPANLDYIFHKSYDITPADLRKTILTLAVQGKLVPQDPSDEPVFARKDAEIDFNSPPGWLSGTVFDLALLKSGNSFPNEEELAEGKYLYVKVSDMNLPENQHEITTSSRFINPEDRDLRGLIPANAIIFPKRGGAIATNKKRLVRLPIFVDSNTMAMICPPFIELRYLHIWFLGIDLWELNSGTSVPQINNKDIGPLVIPIPPLAEQRRIVAKVDQLMALVDQLETQLAASRSAAEKLMEALVAELTTTNKQAPHLRKKNPNINEPLLFEGVL